MKLMITGCWERTTLEDVGSRFASGEHAVPPAPSTLITRWHDPSSKRLRVSPAGAAGSPPPPGLRKSRTLLGHRPPDDAVEVEPGIEGAEL